MGSERRALVAAAGSLALLAAAARAAAPAFDESASAGAALTQARKDAGLDDAWISVGREDLDRLSTAEALGLGAPLATGERASVYRVSNEELGRLATLMHSKFRKCGGFFAHATRAEAEADLLAPPPAAAAAYTIDQGALLSPMVERASESSLRETIAAFSAFQNRYYQSESGSQAAHWLAGRWKELAKGLPGASVRTVAHAGWKQPSVVLTIPGADAPEETVVLGGHLDSIAGWGSASARAPGADDNASGIATLTEAIRLLSEAGFRPARTVEFMGYAAEEVGLRGSSDLARQYKAAGRRVIGVVQFDMTNFAGSGPGIWTLSDHVDPALSAHLAALARAYAGVPVASTACGYACSDHASWTRAGYPASAAFEAAFDDMNGHIHTERDTLATSGGTAAQSVPFARLAAAFAVETAKPSRRALAKNP